MAGYSKRTLSEKLGLKAGARGTFVGMPPEILRAIQPLPEGFEMVAPEARDLDYIHFFAESVEDLEKAFPQLKKRLDKNGMLWISWRKGKRGTDLTENDVRRTALAAGLVDVKVCAVDETWSGLKLVFRVKDR